MNRDELKEALTGMGISFANNASTEKLQALYDEALAAKAAGGETPNPPAPQEVTSFPAPAEITEEEIIAKVIAGLSRAQAIEVITNQRLHDAGLAGA